MHVLLLNLPGNLPYLRGGYCSGVSKGRYYYPAIDLLVQSGYLAEKYNVSVCDAIAEHASTDTLMNYLKTRPVDVILAVTAHCSGKHDLDILASIAQEFPETRLFLTGGYLLFQGNRILAENDFLEGVLLDFTSPSFCAYLVNDTESSGNDILTRTYKASRQDIQTDITYPVPRHDMFPVERYNLPFSRYRPLSVIHQSFGCPFHCSFCVFSNVEFQIRSTDNILAELEFLKKNRVRELFFGDPTFAARSARSLELCNTMISENLKFSWFCQTRTDVLNEELIIAMKRSGCHTIQFGVETTHKQAQQEYRKRLNFETATYVFRTCRKNGIRILGSIIIGLPGDTRETVLDTLNYLIKEDFDYVSVNIAAPEIGTDFREQSLNNGLFSLEEENTDPTHLVPLLDTPQLTKSEQWDLRNLFLKKFYMRPRYIWKRGVSARSWTELTNLVREGFSLVQATFGNK